MQVSSVRPIHPAKERKKQKTTTTYYVTKGYFTMPTELQTKESKAEWRVFVPVAEGKKLTQEVLGEKFGEHEKRSADGIEVS